MNLVRAPDRLRAGLRELEVTHLAPLDQPLHRAHRVLDRHGLVHAVQPVNIDHVHAQTPQALLARLLHVVGMASGQPRWRPASQRQVAEFGGDEHLVALALERLADQLLVHAVAVGVGRDHQVDAEVDGPVNGREGFLVVGLAVADRHAHAAEPHRRHLRPVFSQLAFLHHRLLVTLRK